MRHLVTAAVLSTAVISTTAQADVWAEREALAQVASEISALERLVNDASQLNENDSRVKFNYDALMQDLSVIRAGINTHLSQPINPVMPAYEDTLGGAYTQANQ